MGKGRVIFKNEPFSPFEDPVLKPRESFVLWLQKEVEQCLPVKSHQES